jgi:divalent metal cation (Fe/Co/Zn/Cd) transporter
VTSSAELQDPVRRIRFLQKLTIAWMIAEAVLSLWAAFRARSPALLAFGGDSAIELFSAAVVLGRFQDRNGKESGEVAERRAARIAGILLIALSLYVAATACATLFGLTATSPSYLGIGVLIAAIGVMPWLAWQKRRLATITQSAALRADAAESMLCAYLSVVALLGLSARAWLHVSWADPIAALAATPFLFWEARRAWRGDACGCSVHESDCRMGE